MERAIRGMRQRGKIEFPGFRGLFWSVLALLVLAPMLKGQDSYSRYLPRSEYDAFEERTSQKYVGVGIEIENTSQGVNIVRVFPGGPAEKAGLQAGDRILWVESPSGTVRTVGEASQRLRGRRGSRVEVCLFRESENREIIVRMRRDSVRITALEGAELGRNGVAYFHIEQFGEETAEEIEEKLDDWERRGMKALIIDVRNNPGGLLDAGVDVAGLFCDRRELVLYTIGAREGRLDFHARTPDRPREYPIAVLVNRSSASASEIVAGVLQVKERAVVVGERTYGKGSVQSVFELGRGDAFRRTTSLYYLPDGTKIEGVGIQPDVEVRTSGREFSRIVRQRRYEDTLTPQQFYERFGYYPNRRDEAREVAENLLLADNSVLSKR